MSRKPTLQELRECKVAETDKVNRLIREGGEELRRAVESSQRAWADFIPTPVQRLEILKKRIAQSDRERAARREECERNRLRRVERKRRLAATERRCSDDWESLKDNQKANPNLLRHRPDRPVVIDDAPSYVTSLSALNIPIEHRNPPDWHSAVLNDPKKWSWSGKHLSSTAHLLGLRGVYDATTALRLFVPSTPTGTLAANYERAIFDLLYHFTQLGEPIPNIQAKDIDDAVNFDEIISWIRSVDISQQQQDKMIAWLEKSDFWNMNQ